MNNAVFGKTMENVRKHTYVKLVTTEKRINYLVSKSNDHTTKFLREQLLAIEMKKAEILINKPAYLGLSILELSEILVFEVWYDYLRSEYGEKVKFYFMDTDSFIVYIKLGDIYNRYMTDHCRKC